MSRKPIAALAHLVSMAPAMASENVRLKALVGEMLATLELVEKAFYKGPVSNREIKIVARMIAKTKESI